MIVCPYCKRPKDTCHGSECFYAMDRVRLSDVERALLERDVREVEYHLPDFIDAASMAKKEADHAEDMYCNYGYDNLRERSRLLRLDSTAADVVVATCQAWLTRARVALS